MGMNQPGRKRTKMIRYEGGLYSLRALTAKMDQTRETIRARYNALGQPDEVFSWLFLPRAEWEECLAIFKVKGAKGVNEFLAPVKRETRRAYDPKDRSPGWAERKYFPETGKNGFYAGKASNGACVTGHCDLPLLSGD